MKIRKKMKQIDDELKSFENLNYDSRYELKNKNSSQSQINEINSAQTETIKLGTISTTMRNNNEK
jgi:hypothetical protein